MIVCFWRQIFFFCWIYSCTGAWISLTKLDILNGANADARKGCRDSYRYARIRESRRSERRLLILQEFRLRYHICTFIHLCNWLPSCPYNGILVERCCSVQRVSSHIYVLKKLQQIFWLFFSLFSSLKAAVFSGFYSNQTFSRFSTSFFLFSLTQPLGYMSTES